MSSRHLREVVMAGAVVVLVVWAGITYWPPAASLAATEVDTDALDAAAEESALHQASESTQTSAAPISEEGDWTIGTWPPNPFFQSADAGQSELAGDADRLDPAAVERSKYTLTAIVAGSHPLAMIDGRVVRVGDELAEGITVVAIDDLSVTLRDRTRTCVLKLPE